MGIIEALEKRRSYYNINRELPVSMEELTKRIETLTELVPDAFNMKSSRLVVVLGEKQDLLWDSIYEVFGGQIPKDKTDSFKAGAGTVLFFYDQAVVKGLQDQFPLYAGNFPGWALQANAMLQISIWSGLRELGIGASLQHYNPVIDQKIRELFDVPESYQLIAQMPFGGIVEEPGPKEKEDISKRVRIVK